MIRKRLLKLYIVFTLLIIFIIDYNTYILNQNIRTICILVVYACTAYTLLKAKSGLAFVYLSYLILTHGGIQILDLFQKNPFSNFSFNMNWYYQDTKEKAVQIAYLSITVFCFISLTINLFKQDKHKKAININFLGKKSYLIYGEMLVIGFFIFLTYLFVTGKLPLFGTYQDYFSSLENVTFYQTGIFVYALGITLIFSNVSAQTYKLPLFIILLPGLMLLITGNRGELFYPLLAGLGVVITRGIKINKKLVLIIITILFLVIPLISATRNLKTIESFDSVNISITDPFITMGYTLRPLVLTTEWIESGEDFGYGASYFVPIQRGISNFIPYMNKISYEGKPYSFRDRLPTMGYSVVAEAYYNFGILGNFLFMALISLFLSFLGDFSNSFVRLSIVTGITAILINNIRNAFSYVPGQITLFIILLLLLFLIEKVIFKRKDIASSLKGDRY